MAYSKTLQQSRPKFHRSTESRKQVNNAMEDNMMEWIIRNAKAQIGPGSIMMDGWELKGLLGQGGFGDVWLAEKKLLGIRDQSAIKIIRIPRDPAEIKAMRAEGFSKALIQAEFRRSVENAVREIRAMIDLRSHPAIVPCENFDVIQYEEDESWEIDIRMQLLNSLPDWVESKDTRPEDVLRMGISLSDLLSVCEEKSILHRDIKPANIFVDQRSGFKLGDFGLARIISGSGSTHSKGVGTEAFMAPEVFNSGKYDHRADLYSLGLVMYWLLNRQCLPFTNESNSRSHAITRRLSGEPIPPISGIDAELDQIVRKACEADPEMRWTTAQDFHDALIHYLYKLQPIPNQNFNLKAENSDTIAAQRIDLHNENSDSTVDHFLDTIEETANSGADSDAIDENNSNSTPLGNLTSSEAGKGKSKQIINISMLTSEEIDHLRELKDKCDPYAHQIDLFVEDMENEKNIKQLIKLWTIYELGASFPSIDKVLKECREKEKRNFPKKLPEGDFEKLKKGLALLFGGDIFSKENIKDDI